MVPRWIRGQMQGALERYVPVSDDKISLEYKLKRWLEGCSLNPDEAHFFWNGNVFPGAAAAHPAQAQTAIACACWWSG